MKHLWLVTYEYREGIGKDGIRDLLNKLREVGQPPGAIASYIRLDRKGGLIIQEAPDDPESAFQSILQYEPWLEVEIIPITTLEDALPSVQRWITDGLP
jgi:hypothetical protein